MQTKELIIIGGGPAGMSAAIAAYESGIRDLLIIERDDALLIYVLAINKIDCHMFFLLKESFGVLTSPISYNSRAAL